MLRVKLDKYKLKKAEDKIRRMHANLSTDIDVVHKKAEQLAKRASNEERC